MKIVDIPFTEKFKLYAIGKALKEFYEIGYCGGINDTAGSHLYDWLHEQKPIEIPTERKKELWGEAKRRFNTNFRHRLEDEHILHEVYKTLLVNDYLIELQKKDIVVSLTIEK